MSLSEDLQRALTPAPCKVCEALEGMSTSDANALRAALSSRLGNKLISQILQRNGYDIGLPSVSTHRKEGHA